MKKIAGIIGALALGLFGTASATTFDGGVVVEGGGTAQVYDIGGGNLLGLLGLKGAEVGDDINYSTINSLVTSGSLISIHIGSNTGAFGGGSEFDLISGDVMVDAIDRTSDGRVFNALWVVFSASSNLVFDGTATLGNLVTLDGNPLATDLVPVPAALPLMGFGLAGLAALRRRRKAA